MIFLYAFIFSGAICALAQIIKDIFKLTTGHITSIFVIIGSLLSINNFYQKIINIAGAGATLPITNFGYLLSKAAIESSNEGIISIMSNIYKYTQTCIAFSIILGVLCGLIFKPKR